MFRKAGKLTDNPLKLAVQEHTINASRKATVAYPTIRRLLFHMFYGRNFQMLLKSHKMM